MKKSYSLLQIAAFLEAEWVGDAEHCVASIASLASAQPDQLTFLSKKEFAHHLNTTAAGIVLIRPDMRPERALNMVLVDNPYLAYARISQLFSNLPSAPVGVHPSAVVADSASIAATASIGPHCVIGPHTVIGEHSRLHAGVSVGEGSHIGEGCLIYSNVVIYHGVTLGDRVTIHAGTVIGADGFGFAPDGAGNWIKIHQLGGVRIGSDVEIGASSTIDRGALEDTVIADGVILDNQVHIAHNVRLGRGSAIAGCSGVAGSTTIGANCMIGGFSAISGHLTIVDGVHINGGSTVGKSIHEPGHYSAGTMVQEARLWRKNAVRLTQLDAWVDKIKKLQKKSDQ